MLILFIKIQNLSVEYKSDQILARRKNVMSTVCLKYTQLMHKIGRNKFLQNVIYAWYLVKPKVLTFMLVNSNEHAISLLNVKHQLLLVSLPSSRIDEIICYVQSMTHRGNLGQVLTFLISMAMLSSENYYTQTRHSYIKCSIVIQLFYINNFTLSVKCITNRTTSEVAWSSHLGLG